MSYFFKQPNLEFSFASVNFNLYVMITLSKPFKKILTFEVRLSYKFYVLSYLLKPISTPLNCW